MHTYHEGGKGSARPTTQNHYFVASEHDSEAAPHRGRGKQSAQGFGRAALLPISFGNAERNKIKILLRSIAIYDIIISSNSIRAQEAIQIGLCFIALQQISGNTVFTVFS